MFVLRPSSPIRTRKTESPVISAAAGERGHAEGGLPGPDGTFPQGYDVDIVRVMLQDPFKVFVYWHVREESITALTRYFSPQEVAGFNTVLRLIETTGPAEAFFEIGRQGRYWLTVYPDREYEFEIGVRSPIHGYISLIRSNRVRTPRGTVSPEPAKEEDYRLSPPEFMQILEITGFSADRMLSLAITGGDESDAGNLLALAFMRLPEPVRMALMIAEAGGALTPELIATLPEPLRSELLRLIFAGGGLMAATALMHYLPELLREVVPSDREWIGDELHPLRLTPRFFLGGSEHLPLPAGQMRWPAVPRLPSSPGAASVLWNKDFSL
jgi:hypothetical protein